MRIPLAALFLQSIPEGFAILTLIYSIANIKFDWKQISLVSVFLSVIIYLIRLLPITFGVHTIISLSFLIVFTNVLTQADTVTTVIACISSMLILLILETTYIKILLELLNLNLTQFLENEYLRIMGGYLHIVTIFVLSYIIRKIRKHSYFQRKSKATN